MSWRRIEKLRNVVEGQDTFLGRLFNRTIQVLIVISVVDFSIETLPDLDPTTRIVLDWIETSCVVVFTMEYFIRILVAKRPLKFVFSFFGLIDLLAILPFYITTGMDIRSLRILGFLRVFRMAKLLRYTKAITRFKSAYLMIKEELAMFMTLTVILLFLCGVGIYYFEHEAQPDKVKSIFDGLWWAIATFTTVGYGDVYPITAGGKLFTFITLLIGLGIVAVPTGLLSSALSKVRNTETTTKDY